MNIKAFRQDLAQKAQEARKTYLSEDKINVTYSGIKAQTELEKYQSLAEKLELDVQDIVNIISENKNIPKQIRLRGKGKGKGKMNINGEIAQNPVVGDVGDIDSQIQAELDYIKSKLAFLDRRDQAKNSVNKPNENKDIKLEEVAYQLFAIKEAASSGDLTKKYYTEIEDGDLYHYRLRDDGSYTKYFVRKVDPSEKPEDSISSMRKKAEEIGGIPQPSAEDEELAKMRETASQKGGMPDASSAQPQSAKEPQQTFSPKPMDMVIRDARNDGMTQVGFAKKMQDFENSRKTSKPTSSMPYSQRAPEETEAEPEQTSTGPESSYATSQRSDLFKGMVQNALDKTRSSSEFNSEPSSAQSTAAQLLNTPTTQAKEKNYSPMPVEQRLRQAMTSGRKPAPKFDYSASTAQRTQNLLNSMNAKKK